MHRDQRRHQCWWQQVPGPLAGGGSVCVQEGVCVPGGQVEPDPCPWPTGSRDSSPVMRSSSTLPQPQPSSAPPTPPRLSGPSSDSEEEERGDLIQFYNNVYIEQIKDFALKYTSNAVSHSLCFSLINRALSSDHAVKFPSIKKYWSGLITQQNLHLLSICLVWNVWKSLAAVSPEPRLQVLRACVLSEQTDSPPLSPYPFVRLGSPRRVQLSQHHPVYISPHRNEAALSPQEKIFYYFSSSPSKVRLKGFSLIF